MCCIIEIVQQFLSTVSRLLTIYIVRKVISFRYTWSVVMGYFTFLCIHAFEVYVSTVLIMLADSLGSPLASSPPAPQTLYHAPPSQATCE